MKEEKLFKQATSVSGLMLGMAAHTTSSILGPLILLGGFGYLLDKWTKKNPWFLLLGILLAFITTNVLVYRKTKQLAEKFEEYNKEKEEGEKTEK